MSALWSWGWLPIFLGVAGLEALARMRTTPAMRLRRWPTNAALFFAEVTLAAAVTTALALSATAPLLPLPALAQLAAWHPALALPAWLLIATFTAYWLHRVSHAIPLIWRAHRVHHSDPVVDPSTALRHHPVEIVLAIAAFQLPIALFLPAPEHVVLIAILQRAFAAATHTELCLPPGLERWLGLIFVTPLQHLTHHSDHQPETDSNYGEVLNIWDRLFGTFHPHPLRPATAFRPGLAEVPAAKAADFFAMLALPAYGRRPWPAAPVPQRDSTPPQDIRPPP